MIYSKPLMGEGIGNFMIVFKQLLKLSHSIKSSMALKLGMKRFSQNWE